MKRYGNLYPQISTFENLLVAARQAQRSKRYRSNVLAFNYNLEAELFQIQTELTTQIYQPGTYRIAPISKNSQFFMPLTIHRRKLTAQFYPEDLGKGINLDMVLIPSGRFEMGSPEDEPERGDDEGPQHLVTVPDFFMGKYQVTQAQWRIVADYPTVNIKLVQGG